MTSFSFLFVLFHQWYSQSIELVAVFAAGMSPGIFRTFKFSALFVLFLSF